MTNSIERMKRYLLDNRKKNYNKYIDGLIDVKTILSETDLPRHALYKAIDEIEPEATKIRKQNIEIRESKEINRIYNYMKEGIPFEYMEFDKIALFGESSKYVKETNETILKNRIYHIVKKRIEDVEYAFIKQDNLVSMVRRILAIKELEEGNSGFSVSKKFGLHTSNVYRIQKQFQENHSYLPDVNDTTANVILRNIEIYEKFLEGNKAKNLSKEYNIREEMIKLIISVMKDIFDNIKHTK